MCGEREEGVCGRGGVCEGGKDVSGAVSLCVGREGGECEEREVWVCVEKVGG